MDDRTIISVVIPAYNVGRYLRNAVDSASQQTRIPDEIIIVDDGSTDNTGEIARSLGPLVKYIKQEQLGPAAARNRGIKEARGDWIAFLDGDDAWLPWHLGIAMKVKSAYPDAALLCGNMITTGEDTGYSEEIQGLNVRKILLKEFVKHNPVLTSTVLARKEAIIAAGGFDVSFRGPEDYDLWMRVVGMFSAYHIDLPMVKYRVSIGSLSMDDRTFLPQVLKVLDKVFEGGGALEEYADFENTAYAGQYWSASWMAFQRGSRIAALQYLLKAFMLVQGGKKYPEPINYKWIPLLCRYIFGSKI